MGNAQAQTATTLAPGREFSIPELNGTITFSLNGSYSSAQLVDHTWVFKDLVLNNSQNLGTLSVSAKNSNMTINSYRPSSIIGRSQVLQYTAHGDGVQTMNFHLNTSAPTQSSEWMVILSPTTFLSEGKGWKLQSDNTVVLNGLQGNVTVFHYKLDMPDDRNLPFYEQHSVAIATVATVVATVAVAVLIAFKVRRS